MRPRPSGEVCSIIIIILFRSEKSDACPWKPRLAVRHNRDWPSIVHSPLHSPITAPMPTYYLHTHTHIHSSVDKLFYQNLHRRKCRRIDLFNLRCLRDAPVNVPINAFYSHDPLIEIAFYENVILQKKNRYLNIFQLMCVEKLSFQQSMKNKIRLKRKCD